MEAAVEIRACRRCLVEKHLTSFPKHSSGRRWVCYVCTQKQSKAWNDAHPENVLRHQHARAGNRHGLSTEQYEAMLVRQHGVCAVCGGTNKTRRLYVDHDHACCPRSDNSCGQCVRGLLCARCNTALHVVDDPGWLDALVCYRDRHLPDPSVNYV